MWKRVSAIFCESERIPQNTNRIHVFSKSSHRIRRPSEYHARIPRGTAQNTQKNTVFFIVFRIRQRIRYFACRIPTSTAFGAFARPFDEGDRARLCVDWVAIPIQGGGHNSGFYLFCFWCLLFFCFAQLLVDCFSGHASPFAFFLLFPCGLGCVLLLLLQAVGGVAVRERRVHMRGQHAL